MSVGKYGIFLLALLDIIDQNDSLKALPKVEDNNIKKTAEIIRSTANNMFLALKLKSKKDSPRLQYFSVLHSYLTSLSLNDYTTLREIAKLTRVDKVAINNRTEHFIVGLNEMGVEFSDDSKHEVNANGSLPIKEYIEKIWSIRNSKSDSEGDNSSTTVSPEHNVTLEEWKPHPILLNSRRIYKGKINKIRYFPFMVSIHVMNKFACGGSIIKSDLIITAASCLQLAYNNKYFREKPDFLSVRVGSSFYSLGGEQIGVMEIFFHPNYVPKFLHNNLAIMRLVRHIRFQKHRSVKKITIDTNDNDLPADLSGIIIIGWGATSPSDIVKSPWVNRLSSAKLEFYPFADCQAHYGKDFVTTTNVCLGYFTKGEGACNKDAGGPAIFNGVLMGVISFGAAKCGTPGSPTVITKIGYYTNWIAKIMARQIIPKTDSRTTKIPRKNTIFYPPHQIRLKTTTRGINFHKIFQVTKKKMSQKVTPVLRSAEDIAAFNNLVKQMFPKNEVQQSILRTKQLVADLQPFKHRSKNAEMVSGIDRNAVHGNVNQLVVPSLHYKAVTDLNFNPTFRDLLIENDALRDSAQKEPHQQANNHFPESVIVSDFASDTRLLLSPQKSVPVDLHDEKPSTKAVELIQTDNLPMIDFDGDRTGLKSHLYDGNNIYRNVKLPEIIGDFKEVVITDLPETASPDLNTEFSYQRDILPLLVMSKIPIHANPDTPKEIMGNRDFGLPEMETFDDLVPNNKNPSAGNPNLSLDSAILKQLYDSGNPMKELQDALLFDSSDFRTTTEDLDLSVFMLPEKRRLNIGQNRRQQNYKMKQ